MKIGLVTDSTSDLPDDLVARYNIEMIPALLVLEGQEYRDRLDLPRQVFYERLPALKHPPTTAAPPPDIFAARYEKLLSAGAEHIFSIHLASVLSSIVASAQQAARHFAHRVTVIDSGQLSLGLGFQVLAAAEAASQGRLSALAALQSAQKRVRVVALLDTLTYLHRSGRVSWARAMLGTAFSLKPLVRVVSQGRVERLGYVRTARQGEIRLRQRLQTCAPISRLAVLHTGAAARARVFLQNVPPEIPRPIWLVNVTTVIGTHVGPNGLGFAVMQAA